MSTAFSMRDGDGDVIRIIYKTRNEFIIKFQEDGCADVIPSSTPKEIKDAIGYIENEGQDISHSYYSKRELNAIKTMIDNHMDALDEDEWFKNVIDMEDWIESQKELRRDFKKDMKKKNGS